MSDSSRRDALKLAAAAGAAALGTAVLQVTPAFAEREADRVSYESIDRAMERAPKEKPKLSSNDVERVPASIRTDLCENYKPVRPVLVAISDFPLIPGKWRDVIKGLIAIL